MKRVPGIKSILWILAILRGDVWCHGAYLFVPFGVTIYLSLLELQFIGPFLDDNVLVIFEMVIILFAYSGMTIN